MWFRWYNAFMTPLRLFGKYYFPVLLWAGVIFYLSGIPNLAISEGIVDSIMRSGAHVVEFAVLQLLFYRAFLHTPFFSKRSQIELLLVAVILTISYAISDEWHQYFVPTRQASLFDIVLDSVGAFSGALIIAYGKDLPAAFRKRIS